LNFLKLVSLRSTQYNLAKAVNLAKPTRLGQKKLTVQKSSPLKKPTRPKTTQKPCGLRLVHGLSS